MTTLAEPLEVHVEPMRRRHLRAVHRIDKQVYPRPWSLAIYHRELAEKQSRVYRVARVGGEVAGYAGLMIVGGEGHVTSVAVDPSWQGHGLATRLMLAIARGGIAVGCHSFTLEVRVSNTRARALYQRFGFAPVGIRKGYYADADEDAMVMWVHGIDEPRFANRMDSIEAELLGETEWSEP